MAMMGLGIGETVASLLFGRIIDSYGSKLTTVALLIVVLFTNTVTVANIMS